MTTIISQCNGEVCLKLFTVRDIVKEFTDLEASGVAI